MSDAAAAADAVPAQKPQTPQTGEDGGLQRVSSTLNESGPTPKPKPGGKVGRAPVGDRSDLWSIIQKQQNPQFADQQDVNMLVIGSKGAGKTTLIQLLQRKEGQTQPIKPTTGLDYSYIKRPEGKGLKCAHFWEIGGSNQASLLDVVITVENIHTVGVMIVVDLSQPHTVFDTIMFWMLRLKTQIGALFQKMNAKQSTAPTRMIMRMKNRFAEGKHPDLARTDKDKDKVVFIGVPIIIVANKWDQFCSQPSEFCNVMAKTLRWLAHTNGATLLYTPTEKPGPYIAPANPGAQEPVEILRFRGVGSNMAFAGPAMRNAPQFDHKKSIFCVAGKDSFNEIGPPNQVAEKPPHFVSTKDPITDQWKLAFESVFTKPDSNVVGFNPNDPDNDVWQSEFAEPLVDAMRVVKDDELESYRVSREQRLAARRPPAGAAGAGAAAAAAG